MTQDLGIYQNPTGAKRNPKLPEANPFGSVAQAVSPQIRVLTICPESRRVSNWQKPHTRGRRSLASGKAGSDNRAQGERERLGVPALAPAGWSMTRGAWAGLESFNWRAGRSRSRLLGLIHWREGVWQATPKYLSSAV